MTARHDRWRDLALHGTGLRREWALRRIVFATGPRAARALGEIALHATDDALRDRALAAIAALEEPAAVDAVCELAIAFGDGRLRSVLVGAGHEPSDTARRALWLLLTGRFDRYTELDFDGALLRAAYRGADVGLRRRIAEQARAAGRVEWVRVPSADPPAEPSHRLDEEQWATTLRVLAGTRRFDELWRLLPQAPLRWAARLLVELGAGGWRPADDADRAAFDSMLVRVRSCRTPPSARSMFEGPVARKGDGDIVARNPQGDLVVTSLHESWFRDGIDQWDVEGVVVRRVADGEPVMGFEQNCPGRWQGGSPSVRFSADGGLLAVRTHGHPHTVGPWRLHETTPPRFLPFPACCRVMDFAVISDGTVVVSRACHPNGHPPSVQIWNPTECPDGPVRTIDTSFGGHVCGASRLAVTPDEGLLVTVTDARVRTDSRRHHRRSRLASWRLPTAEPGRVLVDGPQVDDLTVAADGRLLLSKGPGGMRLWHLPSGMPAGEPWPGRGDQVTLLPDARLLTNEGHVRRPSGVPWRERFVPQGEEVGWPRAVSRDGTLLATGLRSSRVALRYLPEGTDAGTLDGATSASWPGNPDALWFTAAGGLVATYPQQVVTWNPRPALTGAVPVGAVTPPEVCALRAALAECPPPDRAWLDLLEVLAMWRHRHDIAVADDVTAVLPTDIGIDR